MYIEGTLILLFLSPNSPFPSDGIRYQEPEAKYTIPAGARVKLPSCQLFNITQLDTTRNSKCKRSSLALYPILKTALRRVSEGATDSTRAETPNSSSFTIHEGLRHVSFMPYKPFHSLKITIKQTSNQT